jgi:hypothetical protein
VQIPFTDGVVTGHKVLKDGACFSPSQVVDQRKSPGAVFNDFKGSLVAVG